MRAAQLPVAAHVLLVCCAVLTRTGLALTKGPAWWSYANQVQSAFRGDPLIRVELSSPFDYRKHRPKNVTVAVLATGCGPAGTCAARVRKACALATLLSGPLQGGAFNEVLDGYKIALSVKFGRTTYAPGAPPATANETAAVLRDALRGNRYYKGVVNALNTPLHIAGRNYMYITFQPRVLQWIDPVDGLPDWSSQRSEVAAQVFSRLFDLPSFLKFRILPSTTICPARGC